MKPTLSVPYGSPRHNPTPTRYQHPITTYEHHRFDKISSTKTLCPDRTIPSDPENIIGTSPKSNLKINEFSSRLLQLDHKHPVKFHPNLSDTFHDNLLFSHQKLSTTYHDASFNDLSKGNQHHNPNIKDTSLKALSLLKTNSAHKSEKIFATKSPNGTQKTTKCLQEIKKLSQPNPVSQASYISRINPVGQVDLFAHQEFQTKTPNKAWPEEKKSLFTETIPTNTTTPTKYKGLQVNTDMRMYETGLQARNLNVPTKSAKKEQGVNIFKCEKKEVRESVNSPHRNTGEESPTQCQDSPIRVNIVRALENKTKGNHDMKNFSIFGLQGDRKPPQANKYASKIKELKLIPIVEIEKKDTDIPEDLSLEHMERREPNIKMINVIARKPDCAPMARKKLADSIEMVLEKSNLIRALEKKIENATTRYCYRMEDTKVFKGVLDFLNLTSLCQLTRVCKKFRSEEHSRLIRKAQCKVIIQGLKEEDQYGFWDFCVNFEFLQRKYPLQYMMNAMKPAIYERDILSDIDRTYTFNEHLDSRQSSLLKVLIAFSNAVPKIGYIQGLNSIAAVFLSHKVTESEAYWLMKYIFKKKRFEEVLTDEFSKVQLLTYQLEIYMRNYLPEIIDHLGENGMNISYFATQWFITIFAYDLELSHLTKIWNLFMIKGWKVLIRIALTILWHFQAEICNQSSDDLPTFLKSFVRERIKEIPENDLFGVALSFKVSNRLLKGLEILYEHSAPINVILESNANNKLEWQIVSDDCSIDTACPSQKNIMEYLNENIDQVRALHKARSLGHNQENQKPLTNDAANVSIALDDVSTEYGPPSKLNVGSKFSDQTFIQTLSNFGQKLKQILTPKDHNQEPFFQGRKASNTKLFDFINPEKETTESQAVLTDRSASRSNGNTNQRNCKLVVANDGTEGTPFKKSIITTLKDRNNKLGINLFEPLNFAAMKDRDYNLNLLSGHKSNTGSIHEAVFHTERKMSTAEAKLSKHKRNSSFNQETTHFLQKSQTLHLGQLLDKKNDEIEFSIRRNVDGLKTQFKSGKAINETNSSLHFDNLSRNGSVHNNVLYLPSDMSYHDSGRKQQHQRGYGLPLNIIKYSERG